MKHQTHNSTPFQNSSVPIFQRSKEEVLNEFLTYLQKLENVSSQNSNQSSECQQSSASITPQTQINYLCEFIEAKPLEDQFDTKMSEFIKLPPQHYNDQHYSILDNFVKTNTKKNTSINEIRQQSSTCRTVNINQNCSIVPISIHKTERLSKKYTIQQGRENIDRNSQNNQNLGNRRQVKLTFTKNKDPVNEREVQEQLTDIKKDNFSESKDSILNVTENIEQYDQLFKTNTKPQNKHQLILKELTSIKKQEQPHIPESPSENIFDTNHKESEHKVQIDLSTLKKEFQQFNDSLGFTSNKKQIKPIRTKLRTIPSRRDTEELFTAKIEDNLESLKVARKPQLSIEDSIPIQDEPNEQERSEMLSLVKNRMSALKNNNKKGIKDEQKPKQKDKTRQVSDMNKIVKDSVKTVSVNLLKLAENKKKQEQINNIPSKSYLINLEEEVNETPKQCSHLVSDSSLFKSYHSEDSSVIPNSSQNQVGSNELPRDNLNLEIHIEIPNQQQQIEPKHIDQVKERSILESSVNVDDLKSLSLSSDAISFNKLESFDLSQDKPQQQQSIKKESQFAIKNPNIKVIDIQLDQLDSQAEYSQQDEPTNSKQSLVSELDLDDVQDYKSDNSQKSEKLKSHQKGEKLAVVAEQERQSSGHRSEIMPLFRNFASSKSLTKNNKFMKSELKHLEKEFMEDIKAPKKTEKKNSQPPYSSEIIEEKNFLTDLKSDVHNLTNKIRKSFTGQAKSEDISQQNQKGNSFGDVMQQFEQFDTKAQNNNVYQKFNDDLSQLKNKMRSNYSEYSSDKSDVESYDSQSYSKLDKK